METVCESIVSWIEEEIEKPIEEWEERQETRCRNQKCNWWLLCLNKLFCWLAVFLVKVIRFIIVTITKVVIQLTCNIVSILLDAFAFVMGIIYSIPVIGGIIRIVANWVLEIIWRTVGILDFFASLVGIKGRKKMRFGLIIPTHDGVPIGTQADFQPQIDTAIEIMNEECNINLIFTGTCNASMDAPSNPFDYSCQNGVFNDLWLQGSYFELVTSLCKFRGGFRRFIGYGGQIVVFAVDNVVPDPAIGCSFGATTNYVMIEENRVATTSLVHEMCHSCLLLHRDDEPDNLMFPTASVTARNLTNWQVAIVRSSRFCTYI
jgi:hypothetical protein